MSFSPLRMDSILRETSRKSAIASLSSVTRSTSKTISLSRYFPVGTNYFYSYPAGQDSSFFNSVPPDQEELVAARGLVCAGPDVSVVVFASTVDPESIGMLRDEMRVPCVPDEHITCLSPSISAEVTGERRNELIRQSLIASMDPKSLVMAQPFLGQGINGIYSIDPSISMWLNSKENMPHYIPASYLPARYANFPNGKEFAQTSVVIPVPCVVKVASSSSGDGVRICRTADDLEAAKAEFAPIRTLIFAEEFIDVIRNFGIQFGIPCDPEQPVEIIGVSEQLTTKEGEFIGGIIDPQTVLRQVDGVNDLLLHVVLPAVRMMGWYGVGGFDVLVSSGGKFFLTDPNFRMTGMTAYLCAVRNGSIRERMMSFSGTFDGSRDAFRRDVLPLCIEQSPSQLLHVISLSMGGSTIRFNAAMTFVDDADMRCSARKLLALGIDSQALRQVTEI